MDSIYYIRSAMAGWFFAATVVGSLWCSHGAKWRELVEAIQSNGASAVVAVIGAIVGIGAPPAFGFLLERVCAVLLTVVGLNPRYYRCAKPFAEELNLALHEHKHRRLEHRPEALFHVFYYAHVDEQFLDWCNRRRGKAYGSLTSALGIVFGLVTAFCLCRMTWFTVVCCLSWLVLTGYGIHEMWVHRCSVLAWADTFGRSAIKDYVSPPERSVVCEPVILPSSPEL